MELEIFRESSPGIRPGERQCSLSTIDRPEIIELDCFFPCHNEIDLVGTNSARSSATLLRWPYIVRRANDVLRKRLTPSVTLRKLWEWGLRPNSSHRVANLFLAL